MPNFTDPFSGNVDKKMTKRELIRALRLGLAAEEEAINLYEAHVDATDDPVAKKVLQDIANEERVHVGELQAVINLIANGEEKFLQEGEDEVRELAQKKAQAKFAQTIKKINQKPKVFMSRKMAQGRGFSSPWVVYDIPSEGPTDAQMSVIVAKYNALSEFMAHMLGVDSSGLILPGAQALEETQAERDARNAKRLVLREKLRKQVFREETKEGGMFEGGFIEDRFGSPLTGKQQEEKKKVFKDFFNNYLDAGVRLVLWQTKGWDPIGNIMLYTAEGITHDTVKAEAQAKIDKNFEDRAEQASDSELEKVYEPNYEGVPIKTPQGPIQIGGDPSVISPAATDLIDLTGLNEDTVDSYMGRAGGIFSEAKDDYDKVIKKYKFQSPEKIKAFKEVVMKFLMAKLVYNSVIEGKFDDVKERIAERKLGEIDSYLKLLGYPKIMERVAQITQKDYWVPSDKKYYSPEHYDNTEEEILNDNSVFKSHAILQYAMQNPNANIGALEDALIETEDVYYMILFANRVPTANKEKLLDAIITLSQADGGEKLFPYLTEFAVAVPGANKNKILNAIKNLPMSSLIKERETEKIINS